MITYGVHKNNVINKKQHKDASCKYKIAKDKTEQLQLVSQQKTTAIENQAAVVIFF